MIKKLRLERFKGFREAELELGPFTVLVGTNASGKSNLHDAFRFLHGIGRGYTLPEILGGKWSEGALQWRGIRGGAREATYLGSKTFALEVDLLITHEGDRREATYHIEVEPGGHATQGPRVVAERLVVQSHPDLGYDLNAVDGSEIGSDSMSIDVRVGSQERGEEFVERFRRDQPILGQVSSRSFEDVLVERRLQSLPALLSATYPSAMALIRMRFFNPNPEAMRRPSIPGQTILSDNGENLSSVLQSLCLDKDRKQALVEWVQSLTPMDAADFQFEPDPTGRVLVMLREKGGRVTSAYSASDGTLRFLALIAALRGSSDESFCFLEELENGIHPARLSLLTQLIEQRVGDDGPQVIATTHSPALLALLSPEAREHAALTYRLEGTPDARIRRILDIPEARRVLEQQDLGRLHATGWLEDAVEFAADREVA